MPAQVPTLVGREHELGRVRSTLDAARAERSGTLVLLGPAGIGCPGAERTYHVDLWSRDDTVQNWFGDPDAGALLVDGELSPDGRRLAATGSADDLRIYSVGAIGGEVALQCVITGLGDIADPTWSPDATQLAWEQADGIHVATIPAAGACDGAPRALVIPGGKTPDWGRGAPRAGAPGGGGGAAGPGAPGGPGAPTPNGPAAELRGLKKTAKLATLLASGVKIKARCATVACSFRATLTVDAKQARKARLGKTRTLATARATGKPGRTKTLKLRPAKKLAAKLRRAKRLDATLTLTASAGGERTVIERSLRLR